VLLDATSVASGFRWTLGVLADGVLEIVGHQVSPVRGAMYARLSADLPGELTR
jgi:hypothetical protein